MLRRHQPARRRTAASAQLPATPYRDKTTRANGLLKQGKTRIAEITDGTSNTIAIGEDAGRDPRYLSPYTQDGLLGATASITRHRPTMAAINPLDPGPAGGYALYRRYWRWAEPDEGYGVSGAAQQQVSPRPRACLLGPRRALHRPGQQRRQQRRVVSFHPGGVNVLMGDGSVRFLKDSVNVVTLRGLVSLAGGEVISADQY